MSARTAVALLLALVCMGLALRAESRAKGREEYDRRTAERTGAIDRQLAGLTDRPAYTPRGEPKGADRTWVYLWGGAGVFFVGAGVVCARRSGAA